MFLSKISDFAFLSLGLERMSFFAREGGRCRRVHDAEESRVVDSILLVAIVLFAESSDVETADDDGRREKGLRAPPIAGPSQLRSKSV